jgi:murein DD-endopeptidase MepM/ murein hydrolase activator NlpD
MKKSRGIKGNIFGLLILCIWMSGLIQCDFLGSSYDEYPFELLDFPFANPENIERMAAFGIPNWSGSEPHNGIDLILYESLYGTGIISPSNGTIESIEISENPYSHPANQMLLSIRIYINSEWAVNLVIEPGTTDEMTKIAQRNAIRVEEGDPVIRGQAITDLLVGEHGYPHLHYMILQNDEPVCAYTFSSTTARAIFDEIALTRSNNNLPDGNICYGDGY